MPNHKSFLICHMKTLLVPWGDHPEKVDFYELSIDNRNINTRSLMIINSLKGTFHQN